MQLEATGKSVELAIQNGLLECGLKRDDVEIKVIENGGLFKNAKVLLIWGEQEVKTEEEQTEQPAEQEEIQEEQPVTPEVKEKRVRVVDTARLEAKTKEFLLGLVTKIDPSATVESSTAENEISLAVKGEKIGKLIGYHGETLQALQSLLAGLKTRGEWPIRVFVDVDGYKANKNQALIDLANKTADQAVKIERNIHLDPMNAYERRIIHTTIQQRADATTESTGEGEKRHVVVKPVFNK